MTALKEIPLRAAKVFNLPARLSLGGEIGPSSATGLLPVPTPGSALTQYRAPEISDPGCRRMAADTQALPEASAHRADGELLMQTV